MQSFRRRIIGCLGLVLFTLVVGVLLVLAAPCSTSSTPYPSPDGRHVAEHEFTGCGGGAGSLTQAVRLRRIEGNATGPTDKVFSSETGRTNVDLVWTDAQTLVISYHLFDTENISTWRTDTWDGVHLVFRQVP
jgi:hypothetical protein